MSETLYIKRNHRYVPVAVQYGEDWPKGHTLVTVAGSWTLHRRVVDPAHAALLAAAQDARPAMEARIMAGLALRPRCTPLTRRQQLASDEMREAFREDWTLSRESISDIVDAALDVLVAHAAKV